MGPMIERRKEICSETREKTLVHWSSSFPSFNLFVKNTELHYVELVLFGGSKGWGFSTGGQIARVRGKKTV